MVIRIAQLDWVKSGINIIYYGLKWIFKWKNKRTIISWIYLEKWFRWLNLRLYYKKE